MSISLDGGSPLLVVSLPCSSSPSNQGWLMFQSPEEVSCPVFCRRPIAHFPSRLANDQYSPSIISERSCLACFPTASRPNFHLRYPFLMAFQITLPPPDLPASPRACFPCFQPLEHSNLAPDPDPHSVFSHDRFVCRHQLIFSVFCHRFNFLFVVLCVGFIILYINLY